MSTSSHTAVWVTAISSLPGLVSEGALKYSYCATESAKVAKPQAVTVNLHDRLLGGEYQQTGHGERRSTSMLLQYRSKRHATRRVMLTPQLCASAQTLLLHCSCNRYRHGPACKFMPHTRRYDDMIAGHFLTRRMRDAPGQCGRWLRVALELLLPTTALGTDERSQLAANFTHRSQGPSHG